MGLGVVEQPVRELGLVEEAGRDVGEGAGEPAPLEQLGARVIGRKGLRNALVVIVGHDGEPALEGAAGRAVTGRKPAADVIAVHRLPLAVEQEVALDRHVDRVADEVTEPAGGTRARVRQLEHGGAVVGC